MKKPISEQRKICKPISGQPTILLFSRKRYCLIAIRILIFSFFSLNCTHSWQFHALIEMQDISRHFKHFNLLLHNTSNSCLSRSWSNCMAVRNDRIEPTNARVVFGKLDYNTNKGSQELSIIMFRGRFFWGGIFNVSN